MINISYASFFNVDKRGNVHIKYKNLYHHIQKPVSFTIV